MSTSKQIRAYREIKQARNEQHLKNTYGMLPIAARHPQACGCGRVYNITDGYGRNGVTCSFRVGDKIVKRDGKWMNVACVASILEDQACASARFVLEEKTSRGEWRAKGWTNDPLEASCWARMAAELEPQYGEERVTER